MTRAIAIAVVLGLLGPATPAWASPAPATPGDVVEIIEIQPVEPASPVEGPTPAAPSEPSSSSEVPSAVPSEGVSPAPPPPNLPTESIRVAVGLSPEVLGDKAERALLDRLEISARASTQPTTEVRRLRVGSAEARVVCREGRDDLIVTIGYLPDRPDPVVFAFDCRIDEELGVRASVAADEPALIGVLWAEHHDRVAAGARERKRNLISPKVKTGLIAGAAVLVIGAAVALLIVGAASRETVVLKVTPIEP